MRRAVAVFSIGFMAGAASFAALIWYLSQSAPTPKPQIAVNAPPARAPADAPPAASAVARAPAAAPAVPGVSESARQAPSGKLIVPVSGIPASALQDTYNQKRGSDRIHEALDILAPKGTPVVAAADGSVRKLFTSKPGGLTLYQFDPTESFVYYYAHLDGYAPNIVEGSVVKQGQLLGYVGSTGNADPNAPHLHFAIFKLKPDKHWWEGTPINPYPLLTQ